ncbi:DUF3592 domain-containing protein [Rhodoflexus sp.]
MRKYIRIIAWAFIILAGFLLGRALYAIFDWNQRIKVYEMVDGVVVEVQANADSTQFFPVISFKALDNQKLRIKSRLSDESVQVGDSVQVLYDLVNPDDMLPVHLHPVKRVKVWIFSAGALFAASFFLLFYLWQRDNRSNFLKTFGRAVQASYQSTEKISLAGIYLYRAKLTAHITYPQEQTLQFDSEWLLDDPAQYWQGREVPVYVNMNREKNYWVSTDLLPDDILI